MIEAIFLRFIFVIQSINYSVVLSDIASLPSSIFISKLMKAHKFILGGGACGHGETKYSDSSGLIFVVVEIIHGGVIFRGLEYLEN